MMRNESVAILDIRSGEISFLLGSKGVNGTFVLHGNHSEKYEGFSVGKGFFDEDSFRRAVSVCITSVRQNYQGSIQEIFVGVPSGAVCVQTKGHTNSYHRKRKISSQDIDALYESGLNEVLAQGYFIRRSNMYFTLGDNRKYFSANDLYGVPTTMLKGALCYYFVSNDFYDMTTSLLKELGFENVQFIPSTLSQATYLFSQKKREGYAFLLDVGFLTSSISVVYGNGIVHEGAFDCGVAQIIACLMTKLGVEYALAEEMLQSANISGGSVPQGVVWTSEQGETYSVQAINDCIKWGLDVLCENVERFLSQHYKEKTTTGLTVNPIGVTGEGIGMIKGATEHISKRLNRWTEVIYPDLPYYDKPMYASRISLLDMALADCTKRNPFYKILNKLGGKR